MQQRIATADILALVKEVALVNLWNSRADEALFVIVVLFGAIVSLAVINHVLLGHALRLFRPTLPTFFVSVYIVLMSVPAVLWFYASPADPIRYTYFLAIQSVLITIPLGMFLANAMFHDASLPERTVNRFFSAPLVPNYEDRLALRIYLFMFGLAALTVTVYMATSAYVPLIGALTSYGDVEGSVVRRSVVAEGDLIHYGHALTARLFMPFCLVYAYFMAEVYGGRWRYLFWGTLAAAAFVSALTFDRMFPLSVVLYLALAVYFKYQDRRVEAASDTGGRRARRRKMSTLRLAGYVAALLLIASLVGGIVSLAQYNSPISVELVQTTAVDFFIDRVLLDASYMAYIYFEEFNTSEKFLYGQSLHALVSLLFGIDFYATISPSFVAELWVNFGWFGVVIGSGLVGFILQLIQVKVFDRKTIPSVSFFLVMLLNGGWIIYGHLIATMVISVYLPSILMLSHLKRRRKAAALAAQRIARNTPSVVWRS